MSHAHPHTYADRPHPEPVVLEIGGDYGALIVHTDATMHGVEVEISPAVADASREHKEVLERAVRGAPTFTAVFDKLREGRYTLWVDDQVRAREVAVAGGEVARLDWRSAAGDPCGDRPHPHARQAERGD